MKLLSSALLLCAVGAFGQFAIRDVGGKSLEVTEGGAPVFTYNYGVMLAPDAPKDRARCCYVHPLYAPNGAVVSDDFPKDHFHHRGLAWMWPEITIGGKKYDGWMKLEVASKTEKILKKEATGGKAVIAVENGWYLGDKRVAKEEVEMTAHPAAGGKRNIDFVLKLSSVGTDATISGIHDGKGYGGFNIRFAPRTTTRIDTATGENVPDSDLKPNAWAELTGNYGGKVAATRITIDPANAGAPNGWCLRHYGFLGVNFPGLAEYKLSATPLVLKYRVTLMAGAEMSGRKKVLVYTRNGKGYVHDNIETAGNAIRKMGAENGFDVDVSDDANLMTDAVLKQYDAVVFSNSNNEAFTNENQRAAFERYLKSKKGFVGIHSASGSERQWPFYWQMLGGKFVRHPKLQKFTVRVVDRSTPATASLPETFEWEDECYFNEFLNPRMRPLLVTDPSKLDDPAPGKVAVPLVGSSLPLAWTLEQEGGRQFYTALGHKKEYYSNPLLYNQILGGILWVMGVPK